MTGRDLIIYILKNNLEDECVFKDGHFIGCITADEAATKMNVGKATINAMVQQKIIPGFKIEDKIYILDSFKETM